MSLSPANGCCGDSFPPLSQAVARGDSVDVKYTGWVFENGGIGKVREEGEKMGGRVRSTEGSSH